MLHLVLEAKPHEQQKRGGFRTIVSPAQELEHRFVDPSSISERVLDRGPRASAAFVALDSSTEALIVGVEVEKILFRINLVAWQVILQQELEEPRGVSDVPTRRTHVRSSLHNVVFDLQRLDDSHGSRSDLLEEIDVRPCD